MRREDASVPMDECQFGIGDLALRSLAAKLGHGLNHMEKTSGRP